MPLNVAVLGAGLSGLAAAHNLARAGMRVLVLEAAACAGGRARLTPHALCTNDVHLQVLIESAGLADELLPLQPLRRAHVRGGALHFGGRHPPPPRFRRLLHKFADILQPQNPEAALRLDDRSTADFITTYFGRRVLKYWAAPLLAEAAGAEATNAGRLQFLLHYLQRQGAMEGVLQSGGVELLTKTLAAQLNVQCNKRVLNVAAHGNGFAVSTVSNSGAGAGEKTFAADAVVSALPPVTAARVLAPILNYAEHEILAGARSAPLLGARFVLRRRLARGILRVRIPYNESKSAALLALQPGAEETQRVYVQAQPEFARAFIAGDAAEIQTALLEELARIFPGAQSAVQSAELLRAHNAWPIFEPGRFRALARLARMENEMQLRGRCLAWAGAWRLGATLEAACLSARRAAAALMKGINLTLG